VFRAVGKGGGIRGGGERLSVVGKGRRVRVGKGGKAKGGGKRGKD
jgi:hypothetical protein